VAKRNTNFLSRLLGRRKSKLTRTAERLAAEIDRRSLREMQNLLFKIKHDYRATHKRYSQIHGFSSYANRIAIQYAHQHQNQTTHSEFVLCQDFIFRPTHVDGCSHQRYADGSAITTANFKSYTQTIPDPQRRLFDFLIEKLKPKFTDEGH